MDHFNASQKIWINVCVGNQERIVSVHQVHEIQGNYFNDSSTVLSCTLRMRLSHQFLSEKVSLDLLDQSEEYQLA